MYNSPIVGDTTNAWTTTQPSSSVPDRGMFLTRPSEPGIPGPNAPLMGSGGFLGGLGGGLENFAGNNWLGYGALAYGGYRAFRSRRVNLVTLGLLVYGLWAIGWISPSLLPRDENGNINWVVLGLSAILPPTAAALVGGVSGIIISTLARGIFKRRKRFRGAIRRFSYRRPFRRRYYRRRY